MNHSAPEDDRPGSWLFGELSHLFNQQLLQDETSCCPQCGVACERMAGGLRSCPGCREVWSVAQMAPGPTAPEPTEQGPIEPSE